MRVKDSLIYNKEGKKVGEVLSKEGKYGFIFFKNKDDQTESVYLDGQILNILVILIFSNLSLRFCFS